MRSPPQKLRRSPGRNVQPLLDKMSSMRDKMSATSQKPPPRASGCTAPARFRRSWIVGLGLTIFLPSDPINVGFWRSFLASWITVSKSPEIALKAFRMYIHPAFLAFPTKGPGSRTWRPLGATIRDGVV
jgi:hypothetical protein